MSTVSIVVRPGCSQKSRRVERRRRQLGEEIVVVGGAGGDESAVAIEDAAPAQPTTDRGDDPLQERRDSSSLGAGSVAKARSPSRSR